MNNQFFSVITETKEYIVINKSAGVIVHGDGRSEEKTLADALLETYPELETVGESWEGVVRPGIVHRLDRETSGVMVAARTQEMFELLKKQFQERVTQKEYRVFVYGHLREDEGVVQEGIGKSKSDFRMWTTEQYARGKIREAETGYKVLERFTDESANDFSYIACFPKTGRTHQIRVHMKYLNHQIVGDSLYGGKRLKIGKVEDLYALGFQRQALHAYKLSFLDGKGERVGFCAELPEDFQEATKFFQ